MTFGNDWLGLAGPARVCSSGRGDSLGDEADQFMSRGLSCSTADAEVVGESGHRAPNGHETARSCGREVPSRSSLQLQRAGWSS
jgi:hypothetical protein